MAFRRLDGLGGCRRLFSIALLLEVHRRPQLGSTFIGGTGLGCLRFDAAMF
jgi:hypothetical protein